MQPSRPAAAQLDPENPWPGLQSYDESSQEFFSGRSAEADELLRRILDEPVTVLFGKSGLGKSSLLRAGVFPRLRDKGFLPIPVRLQIRPGAEPLIEQVRLSLFEVLRTEAVDHAPPPIGQTLWEYLHTPEIEFWTKQNRMARPVFVFDQFEELFTLGRSERSKVDAFREDLADLAENRIPAALAHRVEQRAPGEPEHDAQAMPYKIVLSLREDFLADLEGWRPIMPCLRRNRMRLLPMGPAQALQAMCNEHTRHLISEPLARRIVAFLSSGNGAADVAAPGEMAGLSVEPALLSLFCRGVNERRKQLGARQITEAMFESGKETIVPEFYRRSLQGYPDRVRRFVAEELITEHGYRNSYSVDDALGHGFVTAKELTALVDGRLLRQEHHLGTDRIELTHDILTKAALDERDHRRHAEQAEFERGQRRRLWNVVGVSGVLTLVFLAVAVVAFIEQRKASRLREVAEHLQKVAEKETKTAVTAREEAEKLATEVSESNAVLARAQIALGKSVTKASNEANRAEMARRREHSKELAALAETAQDRDPELAVLLALEGLARWDSGEARSALLTAAQYLWPSTVLDPTQIGGTPRVVALSPDGTLLAVLAGESAISTWDLSQPKAVKIWVPKYPVQDAMFIAFSPDRKLLAVGRKGSVDLLDAQTGQRLRSLPQSAQQGGQIAFSPEGRWLASIQEDQRIRVWDDDRADAGAEVIAPAQGLVEIAILPDAKALVGVGNSPTLFASKLERRPDGTWTQADLNFADCLQLQSASPSAGNISITLHTRTCLYNAATLAVEEHLESSDSRVVDDMVWSPSGDAFAQVLVSQDLVVAAGTPRHARRESHIKGARLRDADDTKMRLLSVSRDGARVALIDQADSIRVYSLAGYKTLLSVLDSETVDVAPDGRWIAMSRQPAPWFEVIPIERALDNASGSPTPLRVPLLGTAERIIAVRDAVAAVVSESPDRPPTTVVYDARSGKARLGPRAGGARRLGATGELLLVGPAVGSRGPQEVLRVRDGSVLAPWALSPGDAGPPQFIVSPAGEALGVARTLTSDATRKEVLLYTVRGERLEPTGRVVDLPASSWLELADDGRSITEMRAGPRLRARLHLTWPVSPSAPTSALDPARAAQSTPDAALPPKVSPLARFEIKDETTHSGATHGFVVVRRVDGVPLKRLAGNYRFSDDDRWLVAWDDTRQEAPGIRVLDLSSGETELSLDPGVVEGVEFAAHNTLLKLRLERGTMLVPLDRALTERFARSLTSRTLTPQERCIYGLGGAECRTQFAVSRAPGREGQRRQEQRSGTRAR